MKERRLDDLPELLDLLLAAANVRVRHIRLLFHLKNRIDEFILLNFMNECKLLFHKIYLFSMQI